MRHVSRRAAVVLLLAGLVLAGLLVGLFLLALCRMCALLYKHRNED